MNKIRQNIFPLLAALIWGAAFSSQAICSDRGMGAFTFNMLRGFVAFLALLIIAVIFTRKSIKADFSNKKYMRELLLGGFSCGSTLFIASNLQQLAFSGTDSGKVGFITVFYVVLVPVAGLLFKKRVPINVWISVVIALAGMYFLCFKGKGIGEVNKYDLVALLCALAFAAQILCIDFFAGRVNGIHLSCAQFAVMTLLSAIFAFSLEKPSLAVTVDCIWHVLYVGIFSSGIAYTLQILAQKDSNPTVVSLLLSLESVFSVLSGAIFLHERLEVLEYVGCGIMFIAVIFSQIPFDSLKKKKA